MEKRTIFVLHRDLSIRRAIGYFEDDDRIPECYHYDDEEDGGDSMSFYNPAEYEGEGYFKTEEDAIKHRDMRVKTYKEMIPVVRRYVNELVCIGEDNEFMQFKMEDALGCYARSNQDYFEEYKEQCEWTKFYRILYQKGVMHIRGHVFRPSDVDIMRWGYYDEAVKLEKDQFRWFVEIILKNGVRLKTYSRVEYRFIEDLFGENYSHREFKSHSV